MLGQKPIFPEIKEFNYMLDILNDMSYGINSDGLSFQEIESYCKFAKLKLNKFEVTTIRQLSFDYLTMLKMAKDKDCEQPYKSIDN